MAAKKAKKSAKKAPKKVKLSMDRETFEKILAATETLGAPGLGFEKFVDDPALARELKKRRKA